MELPKDWLTGKVDPKKLTDQSIDFDRWDADDLSRMVQDVPPFAKARRDLEDFTPTGRPAMNDVFWSLLKAEPTLVDPSEIKPSHVVNRMVMEELHQLDELDRMRDYSFGDDVQSALSASVLEPDVEIIFDRLKKEQEKAQELQQLMQQMAAAAAELDGAQADLDAMMEALAAVNAPGDEDGGSCDGDSDGKGKGKSDPNGDPGDGQGDGQSDGDGMTDEQREAMEALAKAVREATEKLEDLQQQAAAAGEELQEGLDREAPLVQAALQEALNKARQEASDAASAAQAWGLEPGQLQRMNAEERMELARRLNSDRLRKIADLFGPMRNLMFSEQARKTTNSKEEIFDVTTGNDLAHLLPTEFMGLDDEDIELDFLRRFSERSLLQYDLRGTERLARGGIILCEDGSGSMKGERELWAKAVMLCLLNLARTQNRTMHVIHFGSPRQFRLISFERPEDFTLDRILEAAELFFNGGTDFVTPMKEALKILQREFASTGGVRADVVFLTDDECWVDDAFMEEYLNEMHRMDATTWGVTVNGRLPSKDGALHRMSEGKTAMVADFHSGDDVRQVFRTVT